MRNNRVTPTMVRLGELSDDVTTLAGRVIQTLADGPRLIWANAEGKVYSSNPEEIARVPTAWIVGNFDFGQPAADIEEDLRALISERASVPMLE